MQCKRRPQACVHLGELGLASKSRSHRAVHQRRAGGRQRLRLPLRHGARIHQLPQRHHHAVLLGRLLQQPPRLHHVSRRHGRTEAPDEHLRRRRLRHGRHAAARHGQRHAHAPLALLVAVARQRLQRAAQQGLHGGPGRLRGAAAGVGAALRFLQGAREAAEGGAGGAGV